MRKYAAYFVLAMILAELALMLLSWILSAMMVEDVRSMLSSEGMRWYLGHFSYILMSPLLIDLLLLSIAVGCLLRSKVFSRSKTYHERLGRKVSIAMSIVYIAVVSLITLMPHSMLLSATGRLFPSPFSNALLPMIAFWGVLIAVSYGLIVRSFSSFSSIVNAACDGIGIGAPVILCYLAFIQFYNSVMFVFS